MVDKTISELPDGSATQLTTAVCAIEQDGTTFKTSVRPNPVDQIHVTSETQLTSALGGSLIIPAGVTTTVFFDDSFSIASPILIGAAATVEFISDQASTNIVWTGTGALFQLESTAAAIFRITNLNLIGDGTNDLFDLSVISTFSLNELVLSNFLSLGTIDGTTLLSRLTMANCTRGLVIKNYAGSNVDSVVGANITTSANITWLSFIGGTGDVGAQNLNIVNATGATNNMLFFDPNGTGSFQVNTTGITNANLFQAGTDIAITLVADNGSGDARFTAVAHGIEVGKAVILSGFAVSTTYNGTFVVTAQTTNTFDVDVTFTATDIGSVTEQSLTETSLNVIAQNNEGVKDSLSAAETDSTTAILVDIISQGAFVAIQKVTPISGDFDEDPATERFSVDISTGIITYDGVAPLTAIISFQCRAVKVSGGDPDVTVSLFQNGVKSDKTDITVTAPVDPGGLAIYTGGLFSIVNGDIFGLRIANISGTSDITVSDLTLTIREA